MRGEKQSSMYVCDINSLRRESLAELRQYRNGCKRDIVRKYIIYVYTYSFLSGMKVVIFFLENFRALWNDLFIHFCLMLSAVIATDEGEI